MKPRRQFRILVCRGPECGDKRCSSAIYRAFQEALPGCGVSVDLDWQSCFGRCTQGPNVLVREVTPGEAPPARSLAAPPRRAGPSTALYNGVTVTRVGDIVRGHIVGGRVQRQFIERPRIADSTPIPRKPLRKPIDGDS